MTLELLIPFVTAFCDRVRGGYPSKIVVGDPKPWWTALLGKICKYVIYGGTLALTVTVVWWQVLLAGVLFKLGEQAGYQGLIGRVLQDREQTDPHDWQIGILKDNIHLALIVRGIIWGTPPALLAFFDRGFLTFIPAGVIACYAAPWIVKHAPMPVSYVLELYNKFPWQELTRGFLFGLAMVILNA